MHACRPSTPANPDRLSAWPPESGGPGRAAALRTRSTPTRERSTTSGLRAGELVGLRTHEPGGRVRGGAANESRGEVSCLAVELTTAITLCRHGCARGAGLHCDVRQQSSPG